MGCRQRGCTVFTARNRQLPQNLYKVPYPRFPDFPEKSGDDSKTPPPSFLPRGRVVNKSTTPADSYGPSLVIAFKLMWRMLCCLTRGRWAPHRLGSMVKRNACGRFQHTLSCSALQADTESEGRTMLGQHVSAPS
jgi:hypothetical protein